jgi:hypothetical protein
MNACFRPSYLLHMRPSPLHGMLHRPADSAEQGSITLSLSHQQLRDEGLRYTCLLTLAEALAFKGARWWTLAELVQHVAGGGRVLPPWLVDQLPVVLAAGWPPHPDGHWPIDMGELGNIT